MKTLLIFVLIASLFAACKKEDDFYHEHIPGKYLGSLIYYKNSIGGTGENITDDLYQISIKKLGSNYVLSFDNLYKFKIPDLTFEIVSDYKYNFFAIRTLDGQAYSSTSYGGTYMNQPTNAFIVNTSPQIAVCTLTLKNNDPDSTSLFIFNVKRPF